MNHASPIGYNNKHTFGLFDSQFSVTSFKSTFRVSKKFRYFWENSNFTGQRISSIGKVPIEILSRKRHITWVLAALLFTTEFQIEPLTPNAISYDTKPATYQTNYWLVQIKSSTVLDCFLASIIVNNISS